MLEWEKKVYRIARKGGDKLVMKVPSGSDQLQMRQWMAIWQKKRASAVRSAAFQVLVKASGSSACEVGDPTDVDEVGEL